MYSSIDGQNKMYTLSGQNKIGRELTLLALTQSTVIKRQAVNNWS